jgi:hypothetical protein
MIDSLGKVTVTTPGTLVRATLNRSDPAKALPCHGILFEALPTNVGRVYVGRSGLNRTTLAGVFAMLPVPTTNVLPTFSTALTLAPNGLAAHDFYIDADNAGDGVLICFLQL